MKTKICACGCEHARDTYHIKREQHGQDSHAPGKKREGCKCKQYVDPDKYARYQILAAKQAAKQDTPEERAKIAAEMERIAREKQYVEPLTEYLKRFGKNGRRPKRRRKWNTEASNAGNADSK